MPNLVNRIVDVLLEDDADEFVQAFSKSEERVGGRPLSPVPSRKKIVRAIEFSTGHKLFVWRTRRSRENYTGDQARYLGYRFVAPGGHIIFQDTDYHPGALGDPIGNRSVLFLIQGLTSSRDELDDDDLSKLSSEQLAWIDSPECDEIRMDVAGLDDFEPGYGPPWKDLPGYEYTPVDE